MREYYLPRLPDVQTMLLMLHYVRINTKADIISLPTQ